MSETIRQNRVITRKTHNCILCLRNFPAGTEMVYWFGKFADEIQSNYSCLTCHEIVIARKEFEFEEGHVFELLSDFRFDTPEALLADMRRTAVNEADE